MKIVVNNRDFIRNFKKYKDKLVKAEVEKIVVTLKTGGNLVIKLEKEKTPFQRLVSKIDKKSLKTLKRPAESLFNF